MRTSRSTRGLLTTAALLFCGIPTVLAADWPVFKPGQWTFERTMTGVGAPAKPLVRTDCTDPTADQKKQRDMLAKSGCQFTALEKSGNTYRYSATCTMGGMATRSSSVLVVESPEAYTITIDSDVGGEKSHEVLKAKRVGDCAK